MRFKNRTEAGQYLGEALRGLNEPNPVVLALPRGGVPVGLEVAKALQAPLDILIARKIGHPFQPEYAIGAVAEDGYEVIDERERNLVDPEWLRKKVSLEMKEVSRRREAYLPGRSSLDLHNKTAILVDDGIATSYTMRAAIHAALSRGPRKVVVAVPVASPDVADRFEENVDEFVILHQPSGFRSIGEYYDDFVQLSDQEVVQMLR